MQERNFAEIIIDHVPVPVLVLVRVLCSTVLVLTEHVRVQLYGTAVPVQVPAQADVHIVLIPD